MSTESMVPYRYTECGLDNVLVYGLPPIVDDDGEVVYGIPNINGLHKAINCSIVTRDGSMSGKELRFLRTEMGLTQAELGKLVHKEALTVGRWEREETPIDENAETLTRLIAIEKLGLKSGLSVADLTTYSLPKAIRENIEIDGSDPKNYRPIAA